MNLPNIIKLDKSIQLEQITLETNTKLLKENLTKLKDEKIELFLGFEKNIDDEIEEVLEKIKNKLNIYYAIYKNNLFVGWFYLYGINEKYSRANLSLGIISEKRYHILSLKHVITLLNVLFSNGFSRLALEIEDTNIDSLKLAKHLEKIGFEYEGKLRDNYGPNINSNVWSLLKRDFLF